MNINDFLGLGIVGVIISMLIEYLGIYFRFPKKTAVVVISLVFGGLFAFFGDTGWFISFIGMLVSASTFYAIVINE